METNGTRAETSTNDCTDTPDDPPAPGIDSEELASRRRRSWTPGMERVFFRLLPALLPTLRHKLSTPFPREPGERLTPAYAIYEPGFIRLGAALAERYPGIGTPVYRFMFSETYTFGYPPEPYALGSLLQLLTDESGTVPWMVSGLGVDITPLIAAAVEHGGHVRVGLEDAPLGTDRSNVEWVEHARHEIEAAGGTVATPDDVRAAL